jgi:hypothetical protein
VPECTSTGFFLFFSVTFRSIERNLLFFQVLLVILPEWCIYHIQGRIQPHFDTRPTFESMAKSCTVRLRYWDISNVCSVSSEDSSWLWCLIHGSVP